MKKLKIAFVGSGYMANEYAKVLTGKLKNKCEIIGSTNRSNNRIKEFNNKFKVKKHYKNLDDMMLLSKPDIVIVCVSELSTYTVLKKVSNYPCICLIEKPVGLDFIESKKILNLRKHKNFLPFVALNRRHYSSVLNAKKLLENDKSKRIINIFDQENSINAKKTGQPHKVVKNWMYANSIHMIDFAYLFGRGIIKSIKKLSGVKFLQEGIVSTKLIFDSGDVVYYHCIWNRPAPWSLQISTTKYFLELKPIEKLSFLTNKNRKWTSIKSSYLDTKYKPGIFSLLKEILSYKKNKISNLQNLRYSNDLMRLIRNIYFD
ncbi:Gfo/Idh/MocA family oxidoreductase [Candidatus Pelagibacter sp.]|jgi:predicted dehydrogenase|nr:Gfo/Idh/MocA family oxidoreductase [Candidatus Pelagibacter sp.]